MELTVCVGTIFFFLISCCDPTMSIDVKWRTKEEVAKRRSWKGDLMRASGTRFGFGAAKMVKLPNPLFVTTHLKKGPLFTWFGQQKKHIYHFYFCSGGANKKSKTFTFTFVPIKSFLVAKLYPDDDAKRKEKLTFPPHRTKRKTQPTRKRNFEKTFAFTSLRPLIW